MKQTALALACTAVVPAIATAEPAAPAPATIEQLFDERIDAGRGHLWRNLAFGGVSLAGGTGLALSSVRDREPFAWGFGVQTAIWGAIDVGIAVTGLLVLRPSDAPDVRVVARREQLYHDVLLFNMGLDVAYIAVGTTLVIASYHGLDNPREWRGHGAAVIVQGAALLSLETIEWIRSRKRLRQLLPAISIDPAGGGHLSVAGRF